jgi:hypothetical protein
MRGIAETLRVRNVGDIRLNHRHFDLAGFNQSWVITGGVDFQDFKASWKMLRQNLRQICGQRIHNASQNRGHPDDRNVRLFFGRSASTDAQQSYREHYFPKCKRLSQ